MHNGYDSIVVGGGIIGLSCGYHLSRSGRKTLVLDKGRIGGGASGACDDMILLQSKKSGITLDLALQSLELYRSLENELSCDLGFMQPGGMILIENEQERQVMEEFVREQRTHGLDVEIVDRPEMRRRQPNISSRFICSTYCPRDARVDPRLVMEGFQAAGARSGMEVRYNNGVTAVGRTGQGTWRVELSSGEEAEAETIVIAAGAWSAKIGALLGIEIPVTPKRGQLLVTENTPAVGETNLWTASYMVTKLLPRPLQTDNGDEAAALGLGFSFTRTAEGGYLVGSTREHSEYAKRIKSQTAKKLLTEQLIGIVPMMKDVRIIRHIAGLRPATPDGRMLLGPWPGKEGVFVATGHEGDGIALAPITGRLLSDIVSGRPVSPAIRELSPERFS